MKNKLTILFLSCSVTALISCSKESSSPIPVPKTETQETGVINTTANYNFNCTATSVTLIAGQNINAGTVVVTNDANFIYVTYNTANGYVLKETHLFVGKCDSVPVNKQMNPVPGQFPYITYHNKITTYSYKVPINSIGMGKCGCIAAHAALVKYNGSGQVVDSQTGWGNGVSINPKAGNWGMKFSYCTCAGTD